MIRTSRSNAGFSLVELAILMAIIGLIAATAMETYRIWVSEKVKGDTESRRELIAGALTLFLSNYGRLPCPTDPTLAPTNPAAGYEICPATGGAVGACNGAVCRVAGGRDTPADTETTTNDSVFVGALPYASLSLTSKDAIDGWGNKFTYAVTEYLTTRGGTTPGSQAFNDQWGAIRVRARIRDTATGILGPIGNWSNPDAAGMQNAAMLVVVAHGQDGKGAYNYDGIMRVPCTGAGLDVENCNGDGIFIIADKGTGIYNPNPGAEFFDDDFTIYRIRRDADKWTAGASGTMRNKSGGRVGVGVNLPGTELDVGGNVLAVDVRATEFCSTATGSKPSYCFKASMIGGDSVTASQCGYTYAPMLMKGIDGSKPENLDCASVISTLSLTPSTCPAGQYIKGIDLLGNIVCQTP